jgi:hypothetical protein
MADDALIAGAAAPAGTRWIRSGPVLDATWALLVAVAIAVSSSFALIDLPTSSLRTQEAPLRVYVVAVPAVAAILAIAAIVRRSAGLAAAATGTLVPAVALSGSLGSSLFLDDASPFTDVGVPLAVGSALLGIAMFVRWFVYLTPVAIGVDPRPSRLPAHGLLGVGVLLVGNVVVVALLDAPTWSAAFVVSTACMLLGPIVVLAAALARSVESNVLAVAACAAQSVAVVFATLDDGGVEIDSTLALRTGVVGVIALVVGAGIAIVGADRAVVDDTPSTDEIDDPDWRWSADDDV